MAKNKIGWCDITWNSVWGCLNNCKYCYARKISKRFWNQMYRNEFNYYYKKHPGWVWTRDQLGGLWNFKPTFLESQFDKKFPKKPQKIFVGSMSEIAHWKKEWIEKVIEKTKEYPQHAFQFLTRNPEIYSKYEFPKNCWLGITITKENDFYNDIWALVKFLEINYKDNNIKYISFEPLLSKIYSYKYLKHFDWVIVGTETGNRKGKVIPKKEWIENIVDYCRDNNIPVYLKDSLKNIYPAEIKEFPEVD